MVKSKHTNKKGLSLAEALATMLILSTLIMCSMGILLTFEKFHSTDRFATVCVAQDAPSLTTENCTKTINTLKNNTHSTLRILRQRFINAGQNTAEEQHILRIFKHTCNIGGESACDFLVAICAADSNYCGNSSHPYSIHRFLINSGSSHTDGDFGGKSYVISRIEDNYKKDVQNITPLVENLCVNENQNSACEMVANKCVDAGDTHSCQLLVNACNNNKTTACRHGYRKEITRSCKTIKDYTGTNVSGNYNLTIDTDSIITPVSYYCDMATSGGGWTLALQWNRESGSDSWATLMAYASSTIQGAWNESTRTRWADWTTPYGDTFRYERKIPVRNNGDIRLDLKFYGHSPEGSGNFWYVLDEDRQPHNIQESCNKVVK